MDLNLEGKKAIVTGGSRGIGFCTASLLSAEGCDIALGAMRVYANELAQSYGKDGIRANVVSPGAVWFEGGSWDDRKKENPKFYSAVEKSIPLGRLGTADEIARNIAFVASPAGIWINAAHIVANGGQVAAVD